MIYMENRRSGRLSPREREVFILAARGLTWREIAGLLGIAISTVYTYRQRALLKLHASCMLQGLSLALHQGDIAITDIYPTPDQQIAA